jgi:ribosomal protein S12 methylthiotransferase accessory factor
MEISVSFPGGARVNAQIGHFTVATDQPATMGGEDSAPTPFTLFLASLATCAGFYVLEFCKKRGIAYEDIRLIQKVKRDAATKMATNIIQEIQLPSSFPEQYLPAIKRVAESCLVKKHLEHPPHFEITTTVQQS